VVKRTSLAESGGPSETEKEIKKSEKTKEGILDPILCDIRVVVIK
jgi:hypothetical protein